MLPIVSSRERHTHGLPTRERGRATGMEGALLPRGGGGGAAGTRDGGAEGERKHKHKRQHGDKEAATERKPAADALFGLQATAKRVGSSLKRARAASGGAKGEDGGNAAATAQAAAAAAAETGDTYGKITPALTSRGLVPGLRVWGVVKSSSARGVVVALPGGLSAVARVSELSDEHHAAFEAGQEPPSDAADAAPRGTWVRCVVLSRTEDSKSRAVVELSCRASLLNLGATFKKGDCVFGSVKSVEDHGAVVNLGVKGVSGFVPTSELTAKGLEPVVGMPMEAVVTSVARGIATLSLSETGDALEAPAGFYSVQPGVLVRVLRKRGFDDGGELVGFLSHFDAFVPPLLMADAHAEKPTPEHRVFAPKLARVVWVNPTTKQVGVSPVAHLVKREAVLSSSFSGSHVLEDAKVVFVAPRMGVVVMGSTTSTNDDDGADDDNNTTKIFAFVPTNRLADSDEGRDVKRFRVGQRVRARLLGEDVFAGWFEGTMEPSMLESAVVGYGDLEPGKVVKGQVLRVSPGVGVVVSLGPGVRGLVPAMHTTETPREATSAVEQLEVRFKPGQAVTARVLTVDAEAKKLMLTMKKTLVGSPLEAITAYEGAGAPHVGTVSHGVVLTTEAAGVAVGFLNHVQGFLPAHSLGSAASNPAAAFWVRLCSLLLFVALTRSGFGRSVNKHR